MSGGLGRVTHHHEYYLSDGSVSFLTGKTLFRVHKSYFERESEIFRDLFASAQEDDPESGTDKRPFTLDVTPEDFSQFLWVWYDRDYSYSDQSKDKWGTILRLAKRWKFHKMQDLAVRELEALEIEPIERISLYNEHDIDGEKLLQSYVTLCRSPTLPTAAEARLLKMETLIKLLQAREHAQRKAVEAGHKTPTSACLDDDALMDIVSTHFKKNLAPQLNGATLSTLNGKGSETTPASGTHNTIIVQTPQVPDKSSNSNSSLPTSKTKENAEKEREREADKIIPKIVDKWEKVAGAKGETEKAQNGNEIEKKYKQEKEKQEKKGEKKVWGK